MASIELVGRRLASASAGAAAIAVFSSTAAQAHHVMDGMLPSTFGQGLLSGFGHPIIGPDHFAFVVAVGLVSTLFARGYVAPLAFVAATLAGCAIHLFALDLPFVEPVIAVSVVAVGVLLAVRKAIDLRLFTILVAVAGLFHGYAYGESIIGAEPAPLGAYLLGFAIMQSVISLGAYFVAKAWLAKSSQIAAQGLRAAGGLVALVGLVFLSSAVIA